ncbi:mechanosensitive ion channel family protein [Melghirimyces algeriensis]|uniref:Small conductance mechanosensitive channel n=1 Tax=Melghirimyces algeriensis TaxID=910412 RepID=A0A521E032_9BACL|nr:mechanosensitive ion channel family protein [Melghirimyces algeriensis]SMO76480.1 small conductance mechanosensitive channel [Melghirimyces algeriensis]
MTLPTTFTWLGTAFTSLFNMDGFQSFTEEIIEDPSGLWGPFVDDILIPLSHILLIVFLTYISLRYLDRFIDRLLNISQIQQKKSTTLSRLIKSTARYAIYFISVIAIMEKLNIPVTSILAGAGIVGLAIGFGAQSLVKDVISGFFILFDNQMEVGDYVQINGNIEGTVEEIGLRVTKIREFSQRVHYISNGEISRVTNYNRDRMRPVISVTVPYETDQDLVQQTLQQINSDLSQKLAPYLIEPFSIFGVTDIQQDGVEYTIMGVVTPDEYWMVEREMRKMIIHTFNKNGIEIAYPRQVLMTPQNLQDIASLSSENRIKPNNHTESHKLKGEPQDGNDEG